MKTKKVSSATKGMCLAAFLLILLGSAHGVQANYSQSSGSDIGHRYDQAAGQGDGSSGRGRPGGPPQEAIDACTGKSNGDKVEFETPHGDTVSGMCVAHGDLVFAVPEGGPPDQRGGARQQRRN